MWVIPRVSELANFLFKILEQEGFLQLLQYGSGLIEGIASTVRATKPLKYRIVIFRKGEWYALAVSDSKALIDAHWRYLVHDLAPLLNKIDDEEDRKEFIFAKITGLAALEEGEEGKDEQKILSFRSTFPELKAENFVTYVAALWWEAKWLTPSNGHMSLTDQSVVFASSSDLLGQYKMVLPYKQINSITKEVSLGILQNSLKLVTSENKEFWVLVMGGARDKIFQVLESLWNDSMGHWKDKLDPEGVGKLAGQRRISLNMNLLDQKRANAEFQERFRIPDVASYDNTFFCTYQQQGGNFPRPGTIFLTPNFFCYESSSKFPNPVRLVIAWVNVCKITESSTFLGLVSNSFILSTEYSNEFTFSITNRDTVIKTIREEWGKCRNYLKQKTQGIAPSLNSNGWTMDHDRLDNNAYLEEQQELKNKWDAYFSTNGFLPECCISNEFVLLVKYHGVPDVYRGQVWQMCTGSLHCMAAVPGYYNELKSAPQENQRIHEEISRDLHRSLPTHRFMASQSGQTQLQNVLLTYSKRSPHIGYAQSMNILAATALLYMSEEEAFWLLAAICERIVPEQYNSGLELLGSVVDQKIFAQLIEHYLPKLNDYLQQIGVPIVVITFPWFMTFFVGYIPWDASLRVLDIVFSSGTEALFQIGLAVLHVAQEEAFQEPNPEKISPLIYDKLKDTTKVFEVAFSVYANLPTDKIEAWRKKQKFQAMTDLQTNLSHKLCRKLVKIYPTFKLDEIEKLHATFLSQARTQTITKVSDGKTSNQDLLDFTTYSKLLAQLLPHLANGKAIGVLHLMYQLGDRPDKKFMTFEEFLPTYAVIARGNIKQQLKFCFSLIHVDGQFIDQQKFRTVLELLYRISYDGEVAEDKNLLKLDRFTKTVFQVGGQGIGALKIEDFSQTFALEEFWTSLYF